jgi:predicted negative regulator of RcsB-dependent stress response
VESYRTEEEQVEALKRWWDENGRSTVIGIALALVAAFGWQAWQDHRQGQRETASALYQQLLVSAAGAEQDAAREGEVERLAARLKDEFGGTTYAQFASLQLARLAVAGNDLAAAEAELRWVLSQASSGSDVALVARQRLARVTAAAGNTDAALDLLEVSSDKPYEASYALARGDILLAAGRGDEALAAYQLARQLAEESPGQVNLVTLNEKIASLNPAAPAEGITVTVENDQ